MTEAKRHYCEWEDAGGIAVVRLTIKVLREERIIRELFEQLDKLVAEGRSRVVLNLGGLEAFASYAIGKLILFDNKLQPPDCRLALCALSPMVGEIMDIMRLRRKFNIYTTERAALESFA
jgi:anti-anti-sigma factor